MSFYSVEEVAGTEFPAGRRTRVLVGPNAPVEAEHFVMGHVTLYPRGSVPLHEHEQEEVYLIVAGHGTLRAGEESREVGPGSYVYLTPGLPHHLENHADDNMIMVFVYAPKAIVSHWKEELDGHLGQAPLAGESVRPSPRVSTRSAGFAVRVPPAGSAAGGPGGRHASGQ